jgi:hypothetical protein
MDAQQAKTCKDCGKNLPASTLHFRKRKDGSLDIRCLVCRRSKLRGKRKKEDARSLRDIEVGAVASFMTAATTGGESIPHSCEVLERLMEYFGGVSGFTSLLVKQYFDSPAGGATRTKMLDSVLRLVVKNTDQGGAKKPMGQWTDDELESELDGRLRALAAQFQGRIVDGTLSQEEAAGPATAAVRREAQRLPGPAAEGNPGRAGRPKSRGPKAVRTDAPAGGDARLPSE